MSEFPRKDYLGPIKEALGPERTVAFMELLNRLDLNPNDPELVLCAAMASFVISMNEFRSWAEGERKALEAMFSKFVASVDLKVAESFTKGSDDFRTEMQLGARELATSEYRAAASLRSSAIADEIESLKAAARALVVKHGELRSAEVVSAGSSTGGMAAGGGWMSPKVVVVLLLVFVVGFGLGQMALGAHHVR